MSESKKSNTQEEALPVCEMKELLENVPLHSPRQVEELFSQPQYGNVSLPNEIRAHCDHPNCQGIRRHTKDKTGRFEHAVNYYYFVIYSCSNCTEHMKVFALKIVGIDHNSKSGVCTKIYQEPAFGPPIPKRLFQIIGETNRENFLQARRSIARGLGIGAYAYYRRIVENTKLDLITSVLELAQATNAAPSQIELLKKARAETRFSSAIEILRDVSAIPAILLIDGHNPLSILHDLLSEGIHQLNDAECLERAREAEIILCEIADRMQIAMTEKKNSQKRHHKHHEPHLCRQEE